MDTSKTKLFTALIIASTLAIIALATAQMDPTTLAAICGFVIGVLLAVPTTLIGMIIARRMQDNRDPPRALLELVHSSSCL